MKNGRVLHVLSPKKKQKNERLFFLAYIHDNNIYFVYKSVADGEEAAEVVYKTDADA